MAGRTGAARITAGSLDLASTIRGWELHLRAGGRSPATLDKYLRSARQFVAFLEARGCRRRPPGSPGNTSRRGSPSCSTPCARHGDVALPGAAAVVRLAGGGGRDDRLADAQDEGPDRARGPDPGADRRSPGTFLGSCAGKTFVERRDQAILRLFVDCGLRLAELTGLRVEDVDFDLAWSW